MDNFQTEIVTGKNSYLQRLCEFSSSCVQECSYLIVDSDDDNSSPSECKTKVLNYESTIDSPPPITKINNYGLTPVPKSNNESVITVMSSPLSKESQRKKSTQATLTAFYKEKKKTFKDEKSDDLKFKKKPGKKASTSEGLASLSCFITTCAIKKEALSELINNLSELGCFAVVTDGKEISIVDYYITWEKTLTDHKEENSKNCEVVAAETPSIGKVNPKIYLDQVLYVMKGIKFVSLVERSAFHAFLNRIYEENAGKSISIIFEGADSVFTKTRKPDAVARTDMFSSVDPAEIIKSTLLDLQFCNVQYWITKDPHETNCFIEAYCSVLARDSSKDNNRDLYNFSRGISKATTSQEIFHKQLCTLTSISESVARAIVDRFQSYKRLYQECKMLPDEAQRISLIANTMVKRAEKGTDRPVGRSVAGKIHALLFNYDGMLK
jgi:hypothetical protein